MTEDERLVNRQIKKHTGVVQICSDQISLLQRKCFNVLLANAYHDLEKSDTYSIKIWDVCRALGFHDIAELKDSIIKLASTVIEFNTLQSRDKTVWQVSTLLAGASIEDDTLFYSYGPLLRKKLYNPIVYARINLSIQRSFKTKYALILYELACDHFVQNRGYGYTPYIALDDLKSLLGCTNDKTFKDFKYLNRLLKKAIGEVNDKSDLCIRIKLKKKSRMVVAVQFAISPNPEKSGMISELYAPKQAEMPLAPGGILHTRLIQEYNLTPKQASDIVNNHSPQEIEEVLIYVAKQQAAGKVGTLAAYTMSAFHDNYRLPVPAITQEQASENGSQVVSVKEGMLIQLDDGTVHTVEEGEIIRHGNGVIPRAEIIRELKTGKFKIVAAV